MAKIQTFPKSRLRNGELLDAAKAIVQKMKTLDGVITPVKSYYDIFSENVEKYEYSIVKHSKNEFVHEVNQAKTENLNNRSTIIKIVDGYKKSRIDEKRVAAISLVAAISGFRKVRNLSLENLIQDTFLFIKLLESDLYKDKITTLGLTEQVASLKTINNECIELINKKLSVYASRKRPINTENARIWVNKSYDELVDELNAYTRHNGNDKFFELFIWWNAMIDEYRSKISDRYGSKIGGKLDSGASNTPFPDSGGGGDRPEIE